MKANRGGCEPATDGVHKPVSAGKITRSEGVRKMNWDRIEGNWKQFKGKAKEQWGKLTDDDFDRIGGKRDQLAGRIQESYGITKDEAEKQIDDWESRQQ
jgi:uncharacterized protein YjbJ (UPF0337 family)